MNALVLALVLAGSPTTDAPGLHFVAEFDLSTGARALRLPEAPFFFGVDVALGFRFDPVRFGGLVRGLFSNQSGLDVGGFCSVDVLTVKLDSKRSLALFFGVDVMGRWVPGRPSPWSVLLLAQSGVRLVGVSFSLLGGSELPTPLGNGEVRVGVDFVELLSLL